MFDSYLEEQEEDEDGYDVNEKAAKSVDYEIEDGTTKYGGFARLNEFVDVRLDLYMGITRLMEIFNELFFNLLNVIIYKDHLYTGLESAI